MTTNLRTDLLESELSFFINRKLGDKKWWISVFECDEVICGGGDFDTPQAALDYAISEARDEFKARCSAEVEELQTHTANQLALLGGAPPA